MQHLSDVFKFVQGFGQKGHQIGRKIGDALELVVFGMVDRCPGLSNYMVVEDGIEGATTAKHKVEFAFFKKNEQGMPTKRIDDLFGIIECKKVGVEMTVKQSFKKWLSSSPVKGKAFHETAGYEFGQNIAPKRVRSIAILPGSYGANLKIIISESSLESGETSVVLDASFQALEGQKYLLAIDVDGKFYVVQPGNSLMGIAASIDACIIITVEKVGADKKVTKIMVEDCLTGPQTPEKAKQSSFVSLDVRKRVLGHFEKSNAPSRFTSILVIGEASHWEPKSRAMIRLCNDHNLIVPDAVIIRFFEVMLREFGEDYQGSITKSLYEGDPRVKKVVNEVIDHFRGHILADMDTGEYKCFGYVTNPELRLTIKDVNQKI